MSQSMVFAPARSVTRLEDCYFYHTMEIPGYGLVEGEWDLRRGIDGYLGHVDFRHKRVLELGTASGFVCFHMEREGAEVVGYDLSEQYDWDIVPFARYPVADFASERKDHIRKLNNAFWLAHGAFESRSQMVYGDVYSVPREIGIVDISTACSILLHVRDPFLALQNALRLTKETVVVTDAAEIFGLSLPNIATRVARRFVRPKMTFLPDPKSMAPKETWWRLTPDVIQRFIAVLGFERSEVTYHYQMYRRGAIRVPLRQFTVVGHRTVPLESMRA